jgi:hypothetical protein
MAIRVRATREELEQIETLTKEDLTLRQIGEKLDRSEASIRKLRYKNNLVASVKGETSKPFQQRNELSLKVKTLQTLKASLTNEVNSLTKTKLNLEASIKTDRVILKQTLASALMNLKQIRPDLFYFTGAEQMGKLLSVFMNATSKALEPFR